MEISKLSAHNFRSIGDISLTCSSLATLLGPNNHGKSNVLRALEFGLTTSAKPSTDDFFAHRKADDNTMWVEMTFRDLTPQEKKTFERYLQADGSICVRKSARLLGNDNVETFYNGWIEQPEDSWLQPGKAGDFASRDAINQTPLAGLVPSTGRVTKAQVEEAQRTYADENRSELKFVRELEDSPLLGQKNVGGGVLPEFFLIAAVRDLTDEIKVKNTTTFGRLMNRAVREMAERDPRFATVRDQLADVIAELNLRDTASGKINELAALEKSIEGELQAWGVQVNIEVRPPEIEKLFELGTDVHLDDGVRTTADRKGHGLQRAMMFALLRAWAATLRAGRKSDDDGEVVPRKQSDSVIFAMEEPELFLHPHAQRRLAAALREISKTDQHQVFLCTHSTHFVDLTHYKEMAIVGKDNPKVGSYLRQCTKELFDGEDIQEQKDRFHMAQWINPERGEIFFSRRAIFVEGETERVLLPYLAKKLDIYDPEVSIIDCGSKHNLPLYIQIANAFQIPYLIVHDEDPLPDPIPEEWNADKVREKKHTFALNEEIGKLIDKDLGSAEVLSPDFENASGVSKGQGKKMGKPLAALTHFEGVAAEDICERLMQVIAKAYA